MKKLSSDVTLSANNIQLIPLEEKHKNALLTAAKDGNLWETWYTSVPNSSNIDAYISKALGDKEKNKSVPFVVIDSHIDKIIGTTRLYDIHLKHRRLSIGYTWYAKSYQKTHVNTVCKILLLEYAFEVLNCIAVQFSTNFHNLPSRTAIAKLGAKQDGIIRNHQILEGDIYRDTVVFSIIESEWAAVKKALQFRLKNYLQK